MSSGGKCILVGKGPPTSVKQLASLKTTTICSEAARNSDGTKPIAKICKAAKNAPPLITVGSGAPKAVVAHAKPKPALAPPRITVGKCQPALSKALSMRLPKSDGKSASQNLGDGAAPAAPRQDAHVKAVAPGGISSKGPALPKAKPQMINRFGNVVSEIMLELASSDSFTAYLDNTAAEQAADDSSADANAGTRSINSRSTKLDESHVIADGAAGMQEVDAPTTPSEQHVTSTSGETVVDANECTVTRATSEVELLRAASKSMFDRGNLLPPPKAKQATAENKPTDSTAEVAFKKAPQTGAEDSTETAARPTVKSPLKVPIPLRKGVAESEREAKAAPDTDKATTPEWTPESRINILTRAANRVRMISRVTQKRDEQFDLPTDAYGYVMNRSMSSASDQSLFRSPGHSGSINSIKDGFANRKCDAASAGYRCYGISRRAGIKLGTISSRYNRVNDALKELEVEDIGAVREAHFLQHTKTVSALWSRHGNVAVSRRDDAQHRVDNFPVLCAVFAKRKAGAT